MSDDNTKQNILNVATALFAEKGYKGTTVREICKKAKTYQISINYHFGNKDNLYREALIASYEYSDECLTFKNIDKIDASPVEKLVILLKSRFMSLGLLSDPKKNEFFRILTKNLNFQECSVPEDVLDLTLKAYMDKVRELLREILGEDVDEFSLDYAVFSMIGQFMAFTSPHFDLKKKILFRKEEIQEEDIDKLVEVIKNTILKIASKHDEIEVI